MIPVIEYSSSSRLNFITNTTIIEAEREGMSARRQGLTDAAIEYNQFSVDSHERELAYSWLSGWETCDEEMRLTNVLFTAKDFADAVDISKLDDHSQHLLRVLNHALREARSFLD